jgi:rfaE bifunctional protein kinase chain/domain
MYAPHALAAGWLGGAYIKSDACATQETRSRPVSKALSLIEGFSKKRVLLLGDTILDVYVYGQAMGKSAETPTIVAKEIETKFSLGGAFLVARNLVELGGQVTFLTMVGDDAEADYVRSFNHERLQKFLLIDSRRRTTTKKRYWVDGYKLLQFDTVDNSPISEDLKRAATNQMHSVLPEQDVVVVADYRHGLLSPPLIKEALQLVKQSGKSLFVDSQLSQSAANHLLYYGADAFCLNLKEARAIDPEFEPGHELACFAQLSSKLGATRVIVKLGEDGCVAAIGGQLYRSRALKVSAVDTCGAGDAFLAALSLSGLEFPAEALRIANAWAALSTQIHGANPPSRPDLLRAICEGSSDP